MHPPRKQQNEAKIQIKQLKPNQTKPNQTKPNQTKTQILF